MNARRGGVIDAEFEIVRDVRDVPWTVQLGRWLVRAALSTVIATLFALFVGWLGLFVLNLPAKDLGLLSTAIVVSAVMGSRLLRAALHR